MCPSASGDRTMHGIVSWGHVPCGLEQYPGVFTRTAYFRDWIDEHKSSLFSFLSFVKFQFIQDNKLLQTKLTFLH